MKKLGNFIVRNFVPLVAGMIIIGYVIAATVAIRANRPTEWEKHLEHIHVVTDTTIFKNYE